MYIVDYTIIYTDIYIVDIHDINDILYIYIVDIL